MSDQFTKTQVYRRRKDDREELGVVENGQFYAFGFVSAPQFDADAAEHASAQATAQANAPTGDGS